MAICTVCGRHAEVGQGPCVCGSGRIKSVKSGECVKAVLDDVNRRQKRGGRNHAVS